MKWYTLRWDGIESFKKSWPCHGLPQDFDSISVETAPDGDVIDLECYDSAGQLLDSETFDGPALVALIDDTIRLGDVS
jgi:hypothetical protein